MPTLVATDPLDTVNAAPRPEPPAVQPSPIILTPPAAQPAAFEQAPAHRSADASPDDLQFATWEDAEWQ